LSSEAAAARRAIDEELLEKSLGTDRPPVPPFWTHVEEKIKTLGGTVTTNHDGTRRINLPNGVFIHVALCPADLEPALLESMGPLGYYAWSRLRPVSGIIRAQLPELLRENPGAFAYHHIGDIARYDARRVEAELQLAAIHLPEDQRGFSWVGAGGGHRKGVSSTHPAYPASVVMLVMRPSELRGILAPVPDSVRKETMTRLSEQQKKSKTARHKAREAKAASSGTTSSTLDESAFDKDDDDDDDSLEVIGE